MTMTDNGNNANLRPRLSSDEQKKTRLNFFASWMNKLAAAYRTEITTETQAMFLQELSDLPLDRLDMAFKRAVRECAFFPKIAEIRQFEAAVQIEPEKLTAAYERLKRQIETSPEPKQLASVLDEQPRKFVPRIVKPLSEAELKARLEELTKQKIHIEGQ